MVWAPDHDLSAGVVKYHDYVDSKNRTPMQNLMFITRYKLQTNMRVSELDHTESTGVRVGILSNRTRIGKVAAGGAS
jgi:hypothetical protein